MNTNSIVSQVELQEALNRYVLNPDDCARIVSIARSAGLILAPHEAELIWRWWSERVAAGWLMIIDDYDVIQVIERFVELNG